MKKLLIALSSVIILSACGSGGGGGIVNNYPVGTCISKSPTFSPTIFSSPSEQGFAYANAGSNTNLTLYYTETESTPNYSNFVGNFANANTALPSGVCAMSMVTETGAITNLNGTVIYYTNCAVTNNNLQMNITANYGIYLASQTPSTGTPIKSGTLNTSCVLNPI